MTESSFIVEKLGKPELLCKLAEECAEMSQAALKLRRVITGMNPTPVTHDEAVNAIVEEFADVLLCAKLLGYGANDPDVTEIMDEKSIRWARRIRDMKESEKKEQKGD